PAYLAGAIPLGTLMQAHLAIQRVEGAFAFCIGVYAKIAEWKAVMDRISQFEGAMEVVDRDRHPLARINVAADGHGELAVTDLVVRLPSGESVATVPKMRLASGERLMVS